MLSEPLTQIVLAFVTGIAIGNYLPSCFFLLYAGIILTFLISIFLFHFKPLTFNSKPPLLPYFILLSFFLLGIFHLQNSNLISPSDISHLIPGRYQLIGTIIKEPEIGKFRTKLILRAEEIEFQGLARCSGAIHRTNSRINPTVTTEAVVAEFARLCSKNKRRVTGKVWISARHPHPAIKTFHYGDRIKIKNANLSQPSPPGNPGEFDFRNWLAKQKIYTVVESVTRKDSPGKIRITDLEKIGEGRLNPLLKYSCFLRRKIENFIEKIVAGEPESSIIKTMTLGKKGVPDFIKAPFLKTGIFHVLVVSGLHVGFVVLFIALFTPFLSLKWKEIITILTVIFYCLLTGAAPPVLRASLMAIIYFSGLLLNRESNPYLAIAFAGFILLFFKPNQLFAPGFQLSFIVTLGILFFSPYLMEKLPKKIPSFLKGIIAVPIAAQITAFPLLAFHFHYFSLLAPLTNIVLIPLAGLNVGLSFLSIIFGSLFLNLGLILGATVYLFTHLLFKLTKLFAQFPFAYRELGYFSLLRLFCYYCFLISIFKFRRCIPFILLLIFLLVPKGLTKMSSGNFTLTVLKVPDGNSLFIQFPDRKNGLIIGDEDNYRSVERIIKPFLWSQSVSTIDYLLLDRTGDNHLGSLSELSRGFRIREIIDHPESASSVTYKNFLNEIVSLREINYRKAQENQILIDSPLGYKIESLTGGFYRLGYKSNVIMVGMALTNNSYQKLFSLKKELKARVLILPSLPRRKKVLAELIKRVQPEKIILTKGLKEEFRSLPQGVTLFSVQNCGAISLKFE